MKFLEKLNISKESKIYVIGIIAMIIVLFLVTAVVFLALISDKLDVVMTQSAGITYTYFIQVMDRILAILTVFVVFPLTIIQFSSKTKSKVDDTVSFSAIIVLIVMIATFFGGEYHFFQKYKDGKLSQSKMFCNQSAEIRTFNAILKKQGEDIPLMCTDESSK